MVENISYGKFFNHVIGNAFLIRTLKIFFQCVVTHTTGMMVAAMSWNLIQHWCSVRTSSWRYFPVSSCSTLLVLTTSFFNTNTICVQKSKLLNTSLQVLFFSFFYSEEKHIYRKFSESDFLSSRSHNNFTNITWFYYISLYICQIKSRSEDVLPLQCFWRRQGQEPKSRSFSSLLNLEHSTLSKCPSLNPEKEKYNHISFSKLLDFSSV